MIRTNKSKTMSVTDEATLSGFNLTFTYNLESGQAKPLNVRVYGNKSVEGKNMNVNGEATSTSQSLQFQNMDYDATIAKSLIEEMKTILSTDL